MSVTSAAVTGTVPHPRAEMLPVDMQLEQNTHSEWLATRLENLSAWRQEVTKDLAAWRQAGCAELAQHYTSRVGTILLMGVQGSGKGTIAGVMLRHCLAGSHLSTGDILRREATPEQKAVMRQGKFLPTRVMNTIVNKGLEGVDRDTCMLDGYPRTLDQAKGFLRGLSRAAKRRLVVVHLDVDDEIARQRIHSRAEIEGRADDQDEDSVNNRLATYHKETEPVIAYLESRGISIVRVDASQKPEAVYEQIRTGLQDIATTPRPVGTIERVASFLTRLRLSSPTKLASAA